MKLKTQLIASMVFFAIVIAVIFTSMMITNQRVEQLQNQEELLKSIELKIGELVYLSNDYLLYRESQQIDRWESKYASISEDVSNLTVDRPDQQVLVDSIKTNQLRLKRILDDIVSKAESSQEGQDRSNTLDPAFIQVSSSRLAIPSQGMMFDTSHLSQLLREQADQADRRNELLTIILMVAFIAFILTNYLLIYRRTLESMSNLQDGSRIIGSGNLDYRIAEKEGDEFGELAKAFNRMTVNLKTVIASKADLEREVAERKAAEEGLRESEEKFRLVADFTHDWETWQDPKGNYVYISPSCERITGYSAEDFIKNPHLAIDLVHPDDREAFKDHSTADFEGQISNGKIDYRIVTKNGETRWISHLCRSISGRNGEWLGRRASNRDITDRKLAEEALEESEALFRSLVENTTAIIIRLDPAGIITFANQRALDFFSYSAEELIGKHVIGTILPARESSGRDLAKMVDQIVADPNAFHTNANEIICKDGRRGCGWNGPTQASTGRMAG